MQNQIVCNPALNQKYSRKICCIFHPIYDDYDKNDY
ncbi:hypothetical protein Len3610_13665 [Lentibacillus sp. CBA3610]|nr:hypothetical protein Len3610_13665 [Lentibacillus sp. CBA3610]